MDDLRAEASQWCEQVQRLCEAPSNNGSESLTARLQAIGQGLRLRRRLDGLTPDEPIVSSRLAVLRCLTVLQQLAAEELRSLDQGTPRRREVAARVKEWLFETRAAVRGVLNGLRFGPLHQALEIEGLRADLEWLSVGVARLDQEAPHPLTAWLDVELERLRGSLCPSADRHSDPRDRSLYAACEQTQAIVLERRVQHELTRPVAGLSLEALWAHRFQLSRLQAQVANLDLASPVEGHPSVLAEGPDQWLITLERRRADLAAAADDLFSKMARRDRLEPCTQIVQAAYDEVGETIAFLEGMPLPRAVKRLNLVRDDLETLVDSCRRWSRRPVHSAEIAAGQGFPQSDSPSHDRIDPRVGNGDDPDHEAVKLLRRQARRVERLSRRVRGEWQEKVLSLRMELLLGRRYVALLENSVLVLILALIGLIAVETMLERASATGLSAGQHRLFAWTDLAICSVFLFEFALKLILAPHRMTYFLRHLAIDFVASLPFGFFAHSIDLAQLETAVGPGAQPDAWERLVQVGRLARVVRLFRVALPFIRLMRVVLILLRFSDRLVRRMAGLLNRNIILFEPMQAQKAESSDRHRLLTLRSELEQAKTALEARLDRDQRRLLAIRVLGDLDCRLGCLTIAVIEEAAEDGPGREIPVEAVVERLIQMTPERL
ncbi:MAG TPA: ion transporter, partial [Isosphaeraceae bacterium]|nr:ion transporter [Isosphaeraceae bacterium]